MKCLIVSVGKEKTGDVDDAITTFSNRILRYMPLEWRFIASQQSKEKEGEKIIGAIKKDDYVVLLDERGSELRSEVLAELIENRMIDSARRIVFVIGGAYGVSKSVFERANYTWKISALVFPHGIVRLILAEQLYRALTIINGEPYHHA